MPLSRGQSQADQADGVTFISRAGAFGRRFRVYPMPEIDRYVVITPGGASLPLRPLERDEAEPLIALLNEYVLEE